MRLQIFCRQNSVALDVKFIDNTHDLLTKHANIDIVESYDNFLLSCKIMRKPCLTYLS